MCIAILLAMFASAKGTDFHPINDFRLSSDTNRYPTYDRYGDPYSYPNKNTFDLKDTSFIKRTIEYDPKTKQYEEGRREDKRVEKLSLSLSVSYHSSISFIQIHHSKRMQYSV